MIPIFFAGEEFDATFRPIPWLSPHLWGGGNLGTGKWLYGTMLDWEELRQPEHAAMLDDVKQMIAVRQHVTALLGLPAASEAPALMRVQHHADIAVPIPYFRWNGRVGILVAANRNPGQDAHLTMEVPLKESGLAGRGRYRVVDLWPSAADRICTEQELGSFTCSVKRDKTAHGGLHVFKIDGEG